MRERGGDCGRSGREYKKKQKNCVCCVGGLPHSSALGPLKMKGQVERCQSSGDHRQAEQSKWLGQSVTTKERDCVSVGEWVCKQPQQIHIHIHATFALTHSHTNAHAHTLTHTNVCGRGLAIAVWLEELPEEAASGVGLRAADNLLQLLGGEGQLVRWIVLGGWVRWRANLDSKQRITHVVSLGKEEFP